MARLLENVGLGFLTATEDDTRRLLQTVAQEGSSVVGYYGCPCVNRHYGEVQLILTVRPDPAAKRMRAVGFDVHCDGRYDWAFTCAAGGSADAATLRRRALLLPAEGEGALPVDIVNGDVLPSYQPGDILRLQVVAFPLRIAYAWEEAAPCLEALDERVLIRGKVRSLTPGFVQFGGEKREAFIRCLVDTRGGPLELIHRREQVAEEQRELMAPGAFVTAEAILSGDAAIGSYEKGAVLDEAHDLALLRGVFLGGDPERLRYALAKEAEYDAAAPGKVYRGREEIIRRLRLVQKNGAAAAADVAEIAEVAEDAAPHAYPAGKRCLALSTAAGEAYALAFIETDAGGRISRIVTNADKRYRFRRERTNGGKTITVDQKSGTIL